MSDQITPESEAERLRCSRCSVVEHGNAGYGWVTQIHCPKCVLETIRAAEERGAMSIIDTMCDCNVGEVEERHDPECRSLGGQS